MWLCPCVWGQNWGLLMSWQEIDCVLKPGVHLNAINKLPFSCLFCLHHWLHCVPQRFNRLTAWLQKSPEDFHLQFCEFHSAAPYYSFQAELDLGNSACARFAHSLSNSLNFKHMYRVSSSPVRTELVAVALSWETNNPWMGPPFTCTVSRMIEKDWKDCRREQAALSGGLDVLTLLFHHPSVGWSKSELHKSFRGVSRLTIGPHVQVRLVSGGHFLLSFGMSWRPSGSFIWVMSQLQGPQSMLLTPNTDTCTQPKYPKGSWLG